VLTFFNETFIIGGGASAVEAEVDVAISLAFESESETSLFLGTMRFQCQQVDGTPK
jgi:hypothetical protein